MAVTTLVSRRVATLVGVRPAPVRAPRSGTMLLVALVAVCLYAVFAHGAAGLPEEPRLQIAVAAVGVGAAIGLLLTRTLRLHAPPEAWIGVALLVAFAIWCGVTLLWSVAPERTWAHVNRAISYALVLVLAFTFASTVPRAIERLAAGYLLVALVTALYALAGKVMPGVELLGISFDHTSIVSRLRAPLEYWNALALVMVFAIPIALRLATDDGRRAPLRLLGITALLVLFVVLGMTYSRGGLLALIVVLGVVTALGGQRLRGLAVMATVMVVSIPALGLAFSRPSLKDVNVPLAERAPDGVILGLVLAGCLVALLMAAWGLLALERRTRWDDERTRLVWRGLAAIVGVFAVLCLTAIAAGDGGPRAWADNAWERFTETSKDNVSDPARIVSTNSGNRWVWWKEAAGAWSAKPIQGWGAGSFPVTHRLYREVELDVLQPHSMPLQFLAETGIVGATIVLGALGFLLFAALDRVRGLAAGRERDVAVALLAGAVAWLVHSLIDWDWDIPGATIPALLFLGVLVATRPPERGPFASLDRDGGAGARGAALAAACVVLALVAVSAGLPLVADSKASSAQAVSANADDDELRAAEADAILAARLDPTAIRPLLAAAALAEGRGRLVDARRRLLEAAERQPSSAVVWERLLELSQRMADRRGAQVAADRLLELDPIGTRTRALVGRMLLFRTPAVASPTATGTPLSPRYRGSGLSIAPAPQSGPASGVAPTTTPAPSAPLQPGESTGRKVEDVDQ